MPRPQNVAAQASLGPRHIPAGWTSEEKALYFKQWKRAIDLFALTHLEAANSHQTNRHRARCSPKI